MPGVLQVRNISKEELARMDPEERKKPYACESKCKEHAHVLPL